MLRSNLLFPFTVVWITAPSPCVFSFIWFTGILPSTPALLMPPHRLMVWWLSAFLMKVSPREPRSSATIIPLPIRPQARVKYSRRCRRLSAFEMSPTSESAGEQAGLRYMFALLDFPSVKEKDISGRDEMGRCWWWANCFIFQLIFHFSSNLSISQSQGVYQFNISSGKKYEEDFCPIKKVHLIFNKEEDSNLL